MTSSQLKGRTMTVRELLTALKQKGDTFFTHEAYAYTSSSLRPHTDCIKAIDTDYLDMELADHASYCLMDEEEYSNSIYANSSETVDFKEWFDLTDADPQKILVVMVKG